MQSRARPLEKYPSAKVLLNDRFNRLDLIGNRLDALVVRLQNKAVTLDHHLGGCVNKINEETTVLADTVDQIARAAGIIESFVRTVLGQRSKKQAKKKRARTRNRKRAKK